VTDLAGAGTGSPAKRAETAGHGIRTAFGMRRTLLAAILVVTTGVPLAAADTWTTAYKRGDYATAATLLQRAVFEHPGTQAPDPAALKQLALLYGDGKGVERDPVLACGLLRAHADVTSGVKGPAAAANRAPVDR
jgi:hypothetical protein